LRIAKVKQTTTNGIDSTYRPKKSLVKAEGLYVLGVNIFVYTFVGFFMLLMIFFGISQTSILRIGCAIPLLKL
ncbi:MAG: hypothetical protein MZV64_71915, partial [Ignavibacteriales bacterium]|nr:hypothetical protein [Ignavibacteriales bacterium]